MGLMSSNSHPEDALHLDESVAGEEDPGASIEVALIAKPLMAKPSRQSLQTRSALLECEVTGSGQPTIVLFNGAGMTLDSWQALRPSLDAMGTVFAWNRFGTQASAAQGQSETGAVVIASLRELLKCTGADAPYVLVAHSFGALYANLFARLYPDEVAGVLLLEPVHTADLGDLQARKSEFIRSLGKVQGLAPERLEQNLRAELDAVDDLVRETRAAGPFPDVPVAELQGEGNGHFPQIDRPAQVVAELQALLDEVAAGQT